MTRLKFFLTSLLSTLALIGVLALFSKHTEVVISLCVLYIFAQMYIISARFADIGLSGWWFLGLFIPIIGVYPRFMISFAPSGYGKSEHENFLKRDFVYYIGMIFAFILICIETVAIGHP